MVFVELIVRLIMGMGKGGEKEGINKEYKGDRRE